MFKPIVDEKEQTSSLQQLAVSLGKLEAETMKAGPTAMANTSAFQVQLGQIGVPLAGLATAPQIGAAKEKVEAQITASTAQIQNEAEFVNNMLSIMRDVRQTMQEVANAQTEALRTIMRA